MFKNISVKSLLVEARIDDNVSSCVDEFKRLAGLLQDYASKVAQLPDLLPDADLGEVNEKLDKSHKLFNEIKGQVSTTINEESLSTKNEQSVDIADKLKELDKCVVGLEDAILSVLSDEDGDDGVADEEDDEEFSDFEDPLSGESDDGEEDEELDLEDLD